MNHIKVDLLRPWQNEKPPNEVWVEVWDGEQVITAMAFYGRDGYRPHWQLPDGSCCDPSRFGRWRPILETPPSECESHDH